MLGWIYRSMIVGRTKLFDASGLSKDEFDAKIKYRK